MATGGYGRGGRGAALLQALKTPSRKPGESPSPTGSDDGKPQAPLPQMPKPGGRGAMLASLTARAQASGAGDAKQPVSMGRGYPLNVASSPGIAPAGRGAIQSAAIAQVKPAGRGQISPQTPLETKVVGKDSSPQRLQGEEGDARPSYLANMLQRLSMEEPAVRKHGKKGEVVPVVANYIRLKCHNEGVYQYAVSFSPEIDSRGMRHRMMKEHVDVLGETMAFDGAILFLPIQLQEQETHLRSTRFTDGEMIDIRVKLVKVLPPASCIQLYNVVFRKVMNILQMYQVGKHYFSPKNPAQIPQHKLEVWPGYITSVKEYEGGLMMLTDVSHRVLRTQTVLDVMYEIHQRTPQRFQEEVLKQLVGCVVLTKYNNKTYQIHDVSFSDNPRSEFTLSDGSKLSFMAYYKKQYNKDITDDRQPLLVHRPKKRERSKLEVICLIPELSFLTGLTDEMRADFRVMKDLATHTRVSPAQRQVAVRKFCENVNRSPDARKQLMNWGLELEMEMVDLDGRRFKPEMIHFNEKSCSAGDEADWGREQTRNQVITAVDLVNWMVLFTRKDGNKARDFVEMMRKVCPQMGINVRAPQMLDLPNDRTETYIGKVKSSINNEVQVVVTIFPTSRDDRYNAIKKLCCVECPVPSQVINARTISQEKKLRSVTQKIALQINCKLGGELWRLDIPAKKFMVVGIDSYHEAAHKSRSVGGFVASMTPSCTRWYSRVCHQMPGQELIDGLKICMTSALREYHKINHCLPDRIVVFRDGVGDGQLAVVGGYEVQQLSECFAHFGESYQPGLGVIVVQKGINTRIFARNGRGLDNPPPGTVLDHTVTRKEWYDFFLVSQHVRQGTVSPTHYVVVSDSTNWSPDIMQQLSYKMTHLYYNWPGTIRVPAPCQYAHKLAYLVGQNIRRDPSLDLSDRLFFL